MSINRLISRLKEQAAEGEGEDKDEEPKSNPPYKVTSADIRLAKQLCTKLGIKGIGVFDGAQLFVNAFSYTLAGMRINYKDAFQGNVKDWVRKLVKGRS